MGLGKTTPGMLESYDGMLSIQFLEARRDNYLKVYHDKSDLIE